MKYYHCMNEHCDTTFRAERPKSCPCCGGRVLRHAMVSEIDRVRRPAVIRWMPTVKTVRGLAG